MTVESVSFISDLNASYPAAGDNLTEGDDHIRNIKTAIKASFTGVTGAVTATHTELNLSTGLVFLSTQTASSSATIDFTTGISSTYEEYELHIVNAVPATTSEAYLRTSTDGGSTFAASAGNYDCVNLTADGTTVATSTTGSTAFRLSGGVNSVLNTAARGGISGVVRFFNPAEATMDKRFTWQCGFMNNSSVHEFVSGSGVRDATADIDAIRFMFSSGNIASGTFRLYGVKKS